MNPAFGGRRGFYFQLRAWGKEVLMNSEYEHSFFISLRYLTSLWLIFIMACGGSGGGGDTPAEMAPELMWTRQWGTSLNEESKGVAVDSSGNIYVCGHSNGNIDGIVNQGGFDVFLKKFDSAGNWIWTKALATGSDDKAAGVAVDANGFICVTGQTNGDLNGNINSGGVNAFIAKFDSSGNIQWTKLSGTILGETGMAVAVDGNANVYMMGVTYENDVDPFHPGNSDVFLSQYDSFGLLQWRRLISSTEGDFGYGLAADGNGSLFITGHTGGNLNGNTNAGGADAFIVKYSSAGVLLWTRMLGSSGDDLARSVAVDANGNAYITGYTNGNLEGNVNQGNGDAFIAKYDGSGTLQWTKLLGSPGQEFGYAIKAGSDGYVYVSGSTDGNLDGNSNAGLTDIFLGKFDSAGSKRWMKTIGSTDSESGEDIDVRNGDIFMTGETAGNLNGYINSGGTDAFLLKLH
jgi:hypothetical protein